MDFVFVIAVLLLFVVLANRPYFSIKPAKPRIRAIGNWPASDTLGFSWVCATPDTNGYGYTMEQSYQDWKEGGIRSRTMREPLLECLRRQQLNELNPPQLKDLRAQSQSIYESLPRFETAQRLPST